MWLKIEHNRNHKSPRITTNSNLGSARGSRADEGGLAIVDFLTHVDHWIAQIWKLDRFPNRSLLTFHRARR
jgi:hypothetical protein